MADVEKTRSVPSRHYKWLGGATTQRRSKKSEQVIELYFVNQVKILDHYKRSRYEEFYLFSYANINQVYRPNMIGGESLREQRGNIISIEYRMFKNRSKCC